MAHREICPPWRHPDATADASINLEFNIASAKKPNRGNSISSSSPTGYISTKNPFRIFLIVSNRSPCWPCCPPPPIKLAPVGTLSTSYSDPFTVARQFASLDHLSHGRAGWNVVTSPLEGSAKNFSRTEHPEHSLRYRIAGEFLDVAKGLWDSPGRRRLRA